MYIDYNKKIRIIAIYFFVCKVKVKIKKYIIIYWLNKIIDFYNCEVIENKIENGNIIENYNYEQLEAIYSDEIYNLVIAGPGSGKTTLIVGKVNYLIEQKGYIEKDILCLSFTNNACNHLKNKLKYNVDVMTFHKLAKKIVGDNYKINNNYLKFVIDEFFYTYANNNIKIKIILLLLIKKYNLKKYKLYLDLGYFANIKNIIYKFINLYECSGYNYNYLLKIKRNKLLMKIIISIYFIYAMDLKSQNELNLNQLIKQAKISLNESINYKYIIIDEFQDISKLRYDLVKAIREYTNSKILAVGDDFQSIYRFTGSNLSSFFEIINNKNQTKIIKLKMNYRNSKELVEVSNKFIMKNKKQIKKNIITTKTKKKPIVIVKETKNVLSKLLYYLGNEEILILGRNNNDINNYLNSYEKNIFLAMKNIRYSTVHAAKGLESEVVIIINLKDSITGFPSKICESKLLKKYFFKEYFNYEEERRLFYVALTRSMTKVYLLEPSNPSIFLKELKKDNTKNITFLNI